MVVLILSNLFTRTGDDEDEVANPSVDDEDISLSSLMSEMERESPAAYSSSSSSSSSKRCVCACGCVFLSFLLFSFVDVHTSI
jgi:hypothetical protein